MKTAGSVVGIWHARISQTYAVAARRPRRDVSRGSDGEEQAATALGALGVWLALLTSYVWRAASLARYYPRIEREARRE